MTAQLFTYQQSFTLESGAVLPGYHLAYHTAGKLNAAGDNVVWVFHALTANSNPAEWWPGMIGEGLLFDPAVHFIICVNMPGSCYGSSSPLDVDPATGEPYYHRFPFFTPRDMARAYQPLRQQLGINRIALGIGGSMGGQQLLEWAVLEPALFEAIVPLATNAQHSPWGIAFNASQRMAIEADSSWQNREPNGGTAGLEAARSIALLSYRHYDTYGQTQAEYSDEPIVHFKSESYQRYQGKKLSDRFNAFSYYALSQGMDSHNLGRGRGGTAAALQRVTARTLVIGISSDVLYPVQEQQYIASHISGAVFHAVDSIYGHDGFLTETARIAPLIKQFLQQAVTLQQAIHKQENELLT